jgi:mannose-6-phosphate isomerase-like protein (cupin superfamily)
MPTKIESPAKISSAGNKPKIIEEYIGNVNSKTSSVSIAKMKSPCGWIEPGQTPEFEEYSVVLKGMLKVTTKNSVVEVNAGQAIIVEKGEWVQYSTPDPEGAEYVSVCLPAFSLDIVHRDE